MTYRRDRKSDLLIVELKDEVQLDEESIAWFHTARSMRTTPPLPFFAMKDGAYLSDMVPKRVFEERLVTFLSDTDGVVLSYRGARVRQAVLEKQQDISNSLHELGVKHSVDGDNFVISEQSLRTLLNAFASPKVSCG